jgi:hypothetical protein
MPTKMSVNGHGASLGIEVFGYEQPFAQEFYDANWLKCRIAVNVGHFVGNYDATLTTLDFARFRDELRSALTSMKGAASFVTAEEALNYTIELRNTGTAQVRGRAQARGHTEVIFSFSFESDQSFLAETLRGVEKIVQEFPAKK